MSAGGSPHPLDSHLHSIAPPSSLRLTCFPRFLLGQAARPTGQPRHILYAKRVEPGADRGVHRRLVGHDQDHVLRLAERHCLAEVGDEVAAPVGS